MIVKNEEKMLKRTLPNLIKLVDEVILVDTGSTDNTIKTAQKYGAKVYNFPWINDFSAARNESLKYAEGDWILWADADEFIESDDMEKIKAAIIDSKEIGFSLKISECREGEFKPLSYNFRPKIFKNKIGIHFERPINEQPYTQEGKIVVSLSKQLDIPVYHWGGFLAEDDLKKKKERNLEILKKVVEGRQNDEAYHYLLGMNYRDLELNEEAIKEFDKVIGISPTGKFGIQARADKAWCLYNLKKIKESYLEALEVLKLEPDNSSALNIAGAVHIALGEHEKAVEILKDSAAAPLKPDAVIVSLRQKEYLANYLLSQAYLKLGKKAEAYEAAKKAYDFDPTDSARAAMETAKSN